jgi:hypothetical protein
MVQRTKKRKRSVKAHARKPQAPSKRPQRVRNEEIPLELGEDLSPRIRVPQRGVPELSANDIDAAWDRGDEGEETVGGSHATPDQDIVEEVGHAVGVTYSENEPLRLGDKEEKRDSERWEMDPASSEDYKEHITRGKGRRGSPNPY